MFTTIKMINFILIVKRIITTADTTLWYVFCISPHTHCLWMFTLTLPFSFPLYPLFMLNYVFASLMLNICCNSFLSSCMTWDFKKNFETVNFEGRTRRLTSGVIAVIYPNHCWKWHLIKTLNNVAQIHDDTSFFLSLPLTLKFKRKRAINHIIVKHLHERHTHLYPSKRLD